MFDFDQFINKPAIKIFGRTVTITPANNEFAPFAIKGDFHQSYKEVDNILSTGAINSSIIAIFIRDADLPAYYPKINQGDLLAVNDKNYQIIDIQVNIPGSKKLILHESPQINN